MIIRLDKLYLTKYILLIYSILPAFTKIFGISLFNAFYIPLLALLYWIYRKQRMSLYRVDIPFLLMFSITIAYIPISIFILHTASLTSVGFGIFMFLLPMTGYFLSRLININIFAQSVIFVGLVHAVLGILMYGFIQFPSSVQELIERIKYGTMAFRMSSVSGSLGLGALMLVSLPFALEMLLKNKTKINILFILLLLFALIMTMQRSAWLGFGLYIILIIIYIQLKANSKFAKRNIYLFLFALAGTVAVIPQFIDINTLEFISSRINSMLFTENVFNPVAERNSMWLGGIQNFTQVPTGIGLGTTGQAARVGEFVSSFHFIPDGDYFRILSELGISALFFYLYLFSFILIWFLNLRNMSIERFSVYLVVFGLSINMIGSNTTEFHFVNFLYWMSLGYLFDKNLVRGNNAFIYTR